MPLRGCVDYRGHGAVKILIDVGEIALGGSQAAAGRFRDARPAPRAAAVDAKEIDVRTLARSNPRDDTTLIPCGKPLTAAG